MTYATQSDLVTRFGATELIELTDRGDPPYGAIDAAVVSRALSDADDEINSFLAVVATLPLTSVPTIVNRIAADMARYYLHKDRPTDQVRERYDDAIAWLKNVAAGKATLGLTQAGAEAVSEGGPDYTANDRIFSKGSPSQGTVGALDDYLQ